MTDVVDQIARQMDAISDKGDMNSNVDSQVLPQFYPCALELAVIDTRERIDEWDYAQDPHGYCHERSSLVALVAEVEAHRPDIATAVCKYFKRA